MENAFDEQMYPLLLLDHRQHVSGVDGYPGRDVKRYYRSGHWRFHLVLHLHSFDYDDAGSRFDLVANLDQHAHHFPGHGRDDARGFVCLRGRTAGAPQAFRIGERDSITLRANCNHDGVAGFRATLDAAIKNLSLTDNHIAVTRLAYIQLVVFGVEFGAN